MIGPTKYTREAVLDLAATLRDVCSGCNGTGEHPYLSGPDNQKSKCPVCLGFGVGKVVLSATICPVCEGTQVVLDCDSEMTAGSFVEKACPECCPVPVKSNGITCEDIDRMLDAKYGPNPCRRCGGSGVVSVGGGWAGYEDEWCPECRPPAKPAKPERVIECEKCFDEEGSYACIRAAHREKNYTCQYCDYVTTNRSSWEGHIMCDHQ